MTDENVTSTTADLPAAAEDDNQKSAAAALADYFPKFTIKPAIRTKKENLKGMLAEFIATALFVWVGCGTVISMKAAQGYFDGPTSDDFVSTVAMAFGFAIAVLAYAIAPISGGHINPAVTMALFMVGDIGRNRLVGYTLAQFVGAFFGALVLWGCTASDL
jgi:glycerol uptake facilitator-like aquaporin